MTGLQRVGRSALWTIAISAATHLAAGALNPPGAPAPTAPLVEPRTPVSATTTPGDADATFVISQTGSYFLTGNIIGEPGKSGIKIIGGDIALDLGGFTLSGSSGSLDGIRVSGFTAAITISNGFIRSWDQDGINSSTDGAVDVTVRNVVCNVNGGDGFDLGESSVLEGCIAQGNQGDGFMTGLGSVLRDCAADRNTNAGFRAGSGSTFEHCAAQGNFSAGFTGSSTCTYSHCTARGNPSGFSVGPGSVLVACLANGNTGRGIGGSGSVTLTSCASTNNTGANTDGIGVGDGSVVTQCVAESNGRDGIVATQRCSVTGNTSRLNAQDQFQGDTGNLFLNNTAAGPNSGLLGAVVGFHITGGNNRIDGNQVTRALDGIRLETGGNFVVRNATLSCTNNIVFVGDPPSATAYGSIIYGTGEIVTANPWANFSF
jgi:hypothetical protein